jgi:Holliday junction resolvase-like predicted endonuclease
MPAHAKGELNLVSFDGDALAFVEVRMRFAKLGRPRCRN